MLIGCDIYSYIGTRGKYSYCVSEKNDDVFFFCFAFQTILFLPQAKKKNNNRTLLISVDKNKITYIIVR